MGSGRRYVAAGLHASTRMEGFPKHIRRCGIGGVASRSATRRGANEGGERGNGGGINRTNVRANRRCATGVDAGSSGGGMARASFSGTDAVRVACGERFVRPSRVRRNVPSDLAESMMLGDFEAGPGDRRDRGVGERDVGDQQSLLATQVDFADRVAGGGEAVEGLLGSASRKVVPGRRGLVSQSPASGRTESSSRSMIGPTQGGAFLAVPAALGPAWRKHADKRSTGRFGSFVLRFSGCRRGAAEARSPIAATARGRRAWRAG